MVNPGLSVLVDIFSLLYYTNSMNDQELKELVASLAISQQKTDEQQKKTDEQLKKTDEQLNQTDRQLKELRASQADTDRQIKNMNQELGGLGRKFGGFTEGMAFPSLAKLLRERFQMDVISRNVSTHKNGDTMEVDVLAYSNSRVNEIYVGEIKSRFRQEDFRQMKDILNRFFEFFPSHKGKKLYGILTVVDAPENLKKKVLKEGIYLACIHDNEFNLVVPPRF